MNDPAELNQAGKRYIRAPQAQVNPYQSQMPKVGDKIGPNRIMSLIGEGGMANVYKVWHEGLEVARALKILKNANDKELRERFFTEAKILADIHHHNIIEIHNIGYWEQQIPFLEMEFVDGSSIRDLLTMNKRFPVPAALIIAYFVCQALHYAHTKDYTLYGKVYTGLIHRDIKPDNIIISKDGMVKLMDFGIARPSEVSLHTIGGKVMGSLAYLSPEQLEGKAIDHRSDVFSLASVLYEMITGQRAYPQKTISDLVRQKAKGEYRPVESFDIPLPPTLVSVVNKGMAMSLDERYATAADMGNAIFSEFRTLSDRSPADIIHTFLKDPASIRMAVHAKKRPARRHSFIMGALAGGAVLLVLIVLLRLVGLLP
jgi:serine/threonine protein kinase